MTRISGWRQHTVHVGHAALRIGHRAVFFTPCARWQQHIRELGGFRGAKRFLHDHAFGVFKRLCNRAQIWQRLGGVGAGDPQHLDLATFHGVEHFHGCFARYGRQRIDAPKFCDFCAMFRVDHVTMTGQQIGQAADFSPTHCVRLPGQRKRPGTGLADLRCGQMQIDQRCVFIRAASRLIEALAIQRKRRSRFLPPRRKFNDLRLVHATDSRGPRGGAFAHSGFKFSEPFRVRSDVRIVGRVFPHQPVQHRVKQRNVGARQNRQMQIGCTRRLSATRVDANHFQRRIFRFCILKTAIQNRMRPSGVAACNDDQFSVI